MKREVSMYPEEAMNLAGNIVGLILCLGAFLFLGAVFAGTYYLIRYAKSKPVDEPEPDDRD